MVSGKKLKRFSNLRIIQHLLSRIWSIHDSGGVSGGRSLENRLLEAAQGLFPNRIKRKFPCSDEDLVLEAFKRTVKAGKRNDRRRRYKNWLKMNINK